MPQIKYSLPKTKEQVESCYFDKFYIEIDKTGLVPLENTIKRLW